VGVSLWDVFHAVDMAIACLISYWIVTVGLARFVARPDDLLGGMWTVVATIFGFRENRGASGAARSTKVPRREARAHRSPAHPASEVREMPWTPDDAERHTHKAITSELKELWAQVANDCLERTGDDGRAIREANAVIARRVEREI
jgi:hypothetical protein